MTISSQENPLAAWSLLLSRRQEFLNNHPARVLVTPNQKRTHEKRDEVLSSVGSEHMDKSGYHLSDLDDVDFYCENDQLDVDTLLRPGIDTSFHQQRLTTWRWEVKQRTPFCSLKRRTRRTLLLQ